MIHRRSSIIRANYLSGGGVKSVDYPCEPSLVIVQQFKFVYVGSLHNYHRSCSGHFSAASTHHDVFLVWKEMILNKALRLSFRERSSPISWCPTSDQPLQQNTASSLIKNRSHSGVYKSKTRVRSSPRCSHLARRY